MRGMIGEPKPASVAVHYRGASPGAERKCLAQVRRLLQEFGTQIQSLRGKKVIELLPVGAPTKGMAIEHLLARLRPTRAQYPVIYMGDDSSDESVFAILRPGDLGIYVGRPRHTQARCFLNSPDEVRKFLSRLCRIV